MTQKNNRKSAKGRVDIGLNAEIASVLRGDRSFHEKLLALHKVINAKPSQRLTQINSFLIGTNFRIPENDYGESLRIDSRHLEQLERLNTVNSEAMDLNYLFLATTYICANPTRVNNWIEFDKVASGLLFKNRGDEIKAVLLDMPLIDQQALASLKIYAGLHSYSDSLIRDYLSNNLTSAWMKARLLYPIIYYFINLPSSAVLEQMLSHMLPEGQAPAAERSLVRFLLEPRRTNVANLKFRCYVGMLSHPYDALEYITAHYELLYSSTVGIPNAELAYLQQIAESFPEHRLARLVSIARGYPLPFMDSPSALHNILFQDEEHEEGALLEILDLAQKNPTHIGGFSTIMAALCELRWKRYPVRADYDNITVYSQKFAGLSAGYLISHLAYSLYLLERQPPAMERLNVLSGALAYCAITPFLLTGPGGYQALLLGFLPTLNSVEELKTLVETSLTLKPEMRQDRTWIKGVNWHLTQLQIDGKLMEWADGARKMFPIWVEPRYLSGLDWDWLQNVIDTVGVVPFVDAPNGIYVLFMKQLEKGLRESMALRLSIEPVVRRQSLDSFRDWLFQEFGKDATAIIRLFLTADTILKLRLADNYTAAVTTRIGLLEAAVKKFDFQVGVFSEADLAREESVLTATLSRMSVGARQFEIPWDTLGDDAAERNSGSFDAYETMADAVGDSLTVGNAWRKSSYPFSNGAVGDYEAKNRDWPLILVICGVIDTFLSHPTSGIEAILSVRIRHDSFRREFATAIQQVQQNHIAGVSYRSAPKLIRRFEPGIYKEVQLWLDRRVHTARKVKPLALFDFIPTSAEMDELLASSLHAANLEEIIAKVFDWVKPKLIFQLLAARHSLEEELKLSLERRVDETAPTLTDQDWNDGEVTRVGQALKAAISRRCIEIQEWFKVPEKNRDQCLTLAEIHVAVQQRFRMDITAGRLTYGTFPETMNKNTLAPNQIRHLYDLFSELTQNALKHSLLNTTKVRFTRTRVDGQKCITVSNLAAASATFEDTVEGHQYKTLHDTLFGEGKSGTKKIAYLSASLARQPLRIQVSRRRGSFHVTIPLCAWGQPYVPNP